MNWVQHSNIQRNRISKNWDGIIFNAHSFPAKEFNLSLKGFLREMEHMNILFTSHKSIYSLSIEARDQ